MVCHREHELRSGLIPRLAGRGKEGGGGEYVEDANKGTRRMNMGRNPARTRPCFCFPATRLTLSSLLASVLSVATELVHVPQPGLPEKHIPAIPFALACATATRKSISTRASNAAWASPAINKCPVTSISYDLCPLCLLFQPLFQHQMWSSTLFPCFS